jgi:CheY-like chemotaxis protein
MNQESTQPADKPQHLRIVLLDDDDAVRDCLKIMIQSTYQWIEIAEFADGDDAWAELSRKTPDLLITDYKHPGMTCAELFARLAGLRKPCPVILATGYEEMPTTNPRLSLNVEFLAKPFSAYQLQVLLAKHLGSPTPSFPCHSPDQPPEGELGEITIEEAERQLLAQLQDKNQDRKPVLRQLASLYADTLCTTTPQPSRELWGRMCRGEGAMKSSASITVAFFRKAGYRIRHEGNRIGFSLNVACRMFNTQQVRL